MVLSSDPEVKSALNIFVKDLGIVLDESKKLLLQCPTPIASAALQQFISGHWKRLALGQQHQDDSQIVKVNEIITGMQRTKEHLYQTNQKIKKQKYKKT